MVMLNAERDSIAPNGYEYMKIYHDQSLFMYTAEISLI